MTMLGVAHSPPHFTVALAMTLAATACVPLSDLDASAAGSAETGGAPLATGGDGGDGSTSGLGGATGGAPTSGGTGGLTPVGGTGGSPRAGQAGHLPDGGKGGVESHGGRGGELEGGRGGVSNSGGTTGGVGGTTGGTGGGTGGTQCVGAWQNCDSNPDDCETDITSDPAHCGGCGEACPDVDGECINSGCTPPCTWETAIPLQLQPAKNDVPGNGCVKVTSDLGGRSQFQASRETEFTYESRCGDNGSGIMPNNTGSAPIPSCETLINLRGTSSTLTIEWWLTG